MHTIHHAALLLLALTFVACGAATGDHAARALEPAVTVSTAEDPAAELSAANRDAARNNYADEVCTPIATKSADSKKLCPTLISAPHRSTSKREPLARLECSFVFDDVALPHLLRASIQVGPAKPSVRRNLDAGHTITFDELTSGYATLHVTTSDMKLEVLAIEGIPVPATGMVIDARLTDIDLRGRITWMHALVLDSYRNPLASRHVRVEDDAGHSADFPTDSAGWFSMNVPTTVKKLDLVVQGYRRASFRDNDVIQLIPE